MGGVTPPTPVRVCFVAQNILASAYLGHLLHGNSHFRLVDSKQYIHLSPTQRRGTVFIIDQCGLEVPLGELIRYLRERCPDPKFLVVDDEKSNEEIVRLLIIGIHGYVPHPQVSRTLARAIHCVAVNQYWVPLDAFHAFLREAASALRRDTHGRQTTTPREVQILELVRRRLSNKEIAELLHIQVSTVKFHLSNIFSKLHANSRRELVVAPCSNLWKTVLYASAR